jgi:hypothetical protein
LTNNRGEHEGFSLSGTPQGESKQSRQVAVKKVQTDPAFLPPGSTKQQNMAGEPTRLEGRGIL